MQEQSNVVYQLLSILDEQIADRRKEKANDLWRFLVDTGTVPFTVGNRAYFFYKGSATAVHIAGDWTFWQPSAAFHRIDKTDLFYAIQEFPTNAKLQYKLIVDGTWMLDPSNHRTSTEGFGVNSEFSMPEYVDTSFLLPHLPDSSVLHRFTVESSLVEQRREVILQIPNQLLEHRFEKVPLLVVNDGAEAISIGHFNSIVDNLILTKTIDPFVVAYLPPKDRHREYAMDFKFVEFFGEELLPAVQNLAHDLGVDISKDPHAHCLTGASLGGLFATNVVFNYPESFGSAIIQSPSYWWNKGHIFKMLRPEETARSWFFLQTGTVCDARELTFMMYTRLKKSSPFTTYQESAMGHTWGNWRSNIATGIRDWMGALTRVSGRALRDDAKTLSERTTNTESL